jgi:hypothetical protein
MLKAPNLNPAWEAAVKRMLVAPPQPQPSKTVAKPVKDKANSKKVRRNGNGK